MSIAIQGGLIADLDPELYEEAETLHNSASLGALKWSDGSVVVIADCPLATLGAFDMLDWCRNAAYDSLAARCASSIGFCKYTGEPLFVVNAKPDVSNWEEIVFHGFVQAFAGAVELPCYEISSDKLSVAQVVAELGAQRDFKWEREASAELVLFCSKHTGEHLVVNYRKNSDGTDLNIGFSKYGTGDATDPRKFSEDQLLDILQRDDPLESF